MKKLKQLFVKVFRLLAIGSTSIFLAACYGTPNFVDTSWKFKVIDADSESPISGLKLSGIGQLTNFEAVTDGSGTVYCNMNLHEIADLDENILVISDIDPEEHGDYSTRIFNGNELITDVESDIKEYNDLVISKTITINSK